jgi:hypothetical protein
MKLFDILKSGLQACCMILMQDFQDMQERPPSFERLFVLGIALALFGIVSQMLLWGFLRTAVVSGAQPVQPMELLKTGRGYFWKLLLFHLMLSPLFLLVILAVVSGAQVVLPGHVKQQEIPPWLNVVSVSAASLVLLKPMYFVPAQILRKDCGIWDAVKGMRQTQLLRMRYFLTAAVGILVLCGVIGYISELMKHQSVLYYPVLGTYAALSASGMVVLFLAAVLEVDRLMPKKTEESNENEADEIEL